MRSVPLSAFLPLYVCELDEWIFTIGLCFQKGSAFFKQVGIHCEKRPQRVFTQLFSKVEIPNLKSFTWETVHNEARPSGLKTSRGKKQLTESFFCETVLCCLTLSYLLPVSGHFSMSLEMASINILSTV